MNGWNIHCANGQGTDHLCNNSWLLLSVLKCTVGCMMGLLKNPNFLLCCSSRKAGVGSAEEHSATHHLGLLCSWYVLEGIKRFCSQSLQAMQFSENPTNSYRHIQTHKELHISHGNSIIYFTHSYWKGRIFCLTEATRILLFFCSYLPWTTALQCAVQMDSRLSHWVSLLVSLGTLCIS